MRALSLEIIKRRVDRGLYRRLDLLQRDVFWVLARARRLSRTDSQAGACAQWTAVTPHPLTVTVAKLWFVSSSANQSINSDKKHYTSVKIIYFLPGLGLKVNSFLPFIVRSNCPIFHVRVMRPTSGTDI